MALVLLSKRKCFYYSTRVAARVNVQYSVQSTNLYGTSRKTVLFKIWEIVPSKLRRTLIGHGQSQVVLVFSNASGKCPNLFCFPTPIAWWCSLHVYWLLPWWVCCSRNVSWCDCGTIIACHNEKREVFLVKFVNFLRQDTSMFLKRGWRDGWWRSGRFVTDWCMVVGERPKVSSNALSYSIVTHDHHIATCTRSFIIHLNFTVESAHSTSTM